jgi:hypothetical protein
MRIPLIVSWDARLNKRGPTVSLSAGKWTLNSNHKTSNPKVIVKNPLPGLPEGYTMNVDQPIDGPTEVYVTFDVTCKEAGISIYAEK